MNKEQIFKTAGLLATTVVFASGCNLDKPSSQESRFVPSTPSDTPSETLTNTVTPTATATPTQSEAQVLAMTEQAETAEAKFGQAINLAIQGTQTAEAIVKQGTIQAAVDGTLDARNIAHPTQEASATNVPPIKTEKPTETITPSLTPTPSVTPHIESPTPVETPVATPTATPIGGEISSFHVPREVFLALNSDKNGGEGGISELQIEKFRNYLVDALDHNGMTPFGRDLMAEMLSEAPNDRVTLLAGLNFWDVYGGLGWKGEDVKKIAGETDEFWTGNPLTMATERDGVYRYGIRTTFDNIESGIAKGVILRELLGAGIVPKPGETQEDYQKRVVMYLGQPEVDGRVYSLVVALLNLRGITVDANESAQWPGAVTAFLAEAEFLSSDKKTCLAYPDTAKTRDEQKEISTDVEFTPDLEKEGAGNNDTLTKTDSLNDIVLFFTYDSEAAATSGPTLAVNNIGRMRADIFRFSNRADGENANSSEVDDAHDGYVEVDGNRIIPCGNGFIIHVPEKGDVLLMPNGAIATLPPPPGETPEKDKTPQFNGSPTPFTPNQPESALTMESVKENEHKNPTLIPATSAPHEEPKKGHTPEPQQAEPTSSRS